ncbi:MAG: phenylalanine--tRNA ligase subunit beta [Clostridia bacterium]|nr:phenylalanine--tRNA ligase subunit beta [Clostridia bacterium]
MLLSKKWLSEFVDVEFTPREFAETMAMVGFCIAGNESEGEGIKDVVVGKLLKIETHPTDPKYFVCQIDVGGGRTLQQVTAAKNLVEGGLCPVCLPGGNVKGGPTIGTVEFKGVKSEGMLVSLPELGLTQNDFPNGIEDGIYFIDPEETPCQIGDDILPVLGLDDIVFDVEVTANRPDGHSVIGVAREVAAAFNKPFKAHTPVVKAGGGPVEEAVDVRIDDPELCPRYTMRVVKNVKIGPSPKWLRERIRAGGMRPINNIVDITNYVMMEYGQPMHAFDIRELIGKGGKAQVVVRQAGEDKTFVTLDHVERELSPEMLMICNAHEPVGLAGIMGGLQSGIKDDTTMVAFESANFYGPGLRRSGRKLGLRTDALAHYEKGIDAQMTLDAVNRCVELCELLGCAETLDGVIDIDNTGYTQRVIKLEPDKINRLCGTDISREQMVEYLTRLQFEVKGDDVYVPSHRADCEGMADLAEEVSRLYGYNNIPSLPHQGTTQGKYTEEQSFERKMVTTLLGFGYSEAITYTFISPKWYDKIRLPADSPLRNCVVISNPLGEDTSVMRTTTLPSMLETLSKNYNNRNESARIFETGKVYWPAADAEQLPEERVILTLGSYNAGDFYAMKGVIETLLKALHVKTPTFVARREDPSYHPGRCATILLGDVEIGVLGEVHPLVAETYGIGARPCCATLDLKKLFENRLPEANYQPLPRFPALTRDLALVCKEELEVGNIEKVFREVCGELLESLRLFDIYRGKNLPEGTKSVAYALVLRDRETTLTDGRVSKLIEESLAILKDKYGCELRG